MTAPDSTLSTLTTTSTAPQASLAPVAPAAETFSREYVEELRRENAKHRTDNKTAAETARAAADTEWQAKLDAATATHTETQENLSKSELTLLKLTEVLKAKVPSDQVLAIAEHVKGEDEESVSASVKSLKAILDAKPSKDSAVDPSQGSGQGVIPLNGDPILDKLKSVVGSH